MPLTWEKCLVVALMTPQLDLATNTNDHLYTRVRVVPNRSKHLVVPDRVSSIYQCI